MPKTRQNSFIKFNNGSACSEMNLRSRFFVPFWGKMP